MLSGAGRVAGSGSHKIVTAGSWGFSGLYCWTGPEEADKANKYIATAAMVPYNDTGLGVAVPKARIFYFESHLASTPTLTYTYRPGQLPDILRLFGASSLVFVSRNFSSPLRSLL
jgi:hypothetical protein